MSAHEMGKLNRHRVLSTAVVASDMPEANHVVRRARDERVGVRESSTTTEGRFNHLRDLR